MQPPQYVRRKKEMFLERYKSTGNITQSARDVEIGRESVYLWKREDPDFAQAMVDVIDTRCDDLEEALATRGLGWTEDGKLRYDTTAAIAYLNANRPDKYRRDTAPKSQDDPARVAEGAVRGALAFLNETPVAGAEDSSKGTSET